MLLKSGKNWVQNWFQRIGWLQRQKTRIRRFPTRHSVFPSAAEYAPFSCHGRVTEDLEQRILLSTITVTNTLDSGAGSLRNAIANANSGDTIAFDSSTNGTSIDLTSGELEISSSLTITGNGAANTIIDAGQNSRIFDITSAAGNVTLAGMTLENGKTTAAGRSSAGGAGGAIFSASTATLALSADVLSGNSTTGNQASGGAVFASGPVTVMNSTVSGNSTTGPNAAYGGAIYSVATVTVLGSTLSGNSTSGIHSYGGALFTFGDIQLTNSTVTGNSTTGSGSNAGAIWSGAALTATNSTVAQNSAASGQTGGIYQWTFDLTPTITLKNTIVAQNTDNGTAPDLKIIGSATVTVTHSLIGNNVGTGLTEAPVGSPDGNGNFIGGPINGLIDPKLNALADNGGPTKSMALLAGSPAIDKGDNTAANAAGLTTDQRGAPFVRTFGTNVDMGAYERQFALVVTSTADTLDVVPDPAHLTLRDAVALANVNVGPDAITFDPTINGTPIDLTLGELVLSDDVTITGNGAANTIIDAQQSSRIFHITGGGVTLSNMTLQNGKTSGSGGAILSSSSGALAIVGSAITNSTVTGDHVSGGAISDSGGSVSITNSTLTGNSTTGQFAGGGAVYTDTGDVSISGSTLSGNTTGNNYSPGGAISTQHGQVTVTNSTLSNNSTGGRISHGGAVYARFGAATITGSTLSGNSTTLDVARGGAISSGNVVTVVDSTLSGNFTAGISSVGGAIFAYLAATITNSTLTGNSTSGTGADGGAVFAYRGNVTAVNSTIVQNHATNGIGGGVYAYFFTGTVTLSNSILAQNTDNATAPDLGMKSNEAHAISHSLIGDNTGTTLTAAPVGSPDGNGNLIGAAGALIDPKLGGLQNNGGPTQTMAILANSPAIDAGSNALALDPTNAPLLYDQRGTPFSRILGNAVDIGAFESPVTVTAISGTTPQSAVPNFAFANLAVLVMNAAGNPVLNASVTFAAPGGGASGTFGGSATVLSNSSGIATAPTFTANGTIGTYNVTATATGGSNPSAIFSLDNALTVTSFSFAGEYGVTGGSSTLASITQNGNALSLVGSSTVSAAIINNTQILVNGANTAAFGNSSIVFTSGTFAGQTWTKLDLPPDYTNQQGAATHVQQNGSSVTFVNKFGATSPGVWMSPTQLFITNWHESVSIAIGRLLFQDGTIWSENLNITGNKNGSGTTTIAAVPGDVDVIDYVNQSGRAVHLIVNGTTNVVFVDANNHMSLGTFSSSTQATTPFFPGDIATFSNDFSRVSWTDGTTWTQTVPNSAVTVTNYTNQNGVAVHLVQNGTNQLVFIDSVGRLSLGTMQSPTTALADAYPGDLATLSGNTVHWQDGFVWTRTDTAGPSPIVVTDYTNGSGKPVHLIENGTSNVIFIDATSHMSLGTFINSTHASTPYYPNDVATIASNLSTVTWQDGSVWTKTAPTTAITVTSYTTGSGAPVYLIQNGTTQLAFVDRLNRMSLGTMQSPITALADLYPGDLATISDSSVQWQDGTLWTKTTASPLTISFIDTNSAVSHVQLTSPTTLLGLDGSLQGLTGTRVDNRIRWSNGDVWTMTSFDALHALFQMGLGYP